MKKIRKSDSAPESRSSFGSSIFSSKPSAKKKEKVLFAKKHARSDSRGKAGKTHRPEQEKERFIKPPHDPGPKIRPEEVEDVQDYSVEEGGEGVQQALQSTGRGCCGSITGLFWLLGLGSFAVVIIFILKCGGC